MQHHIVRFQCVFYLRNVEMISRKLRFLVILVILSSFAQAKDKCPLQCDCSEDLSVVKCRDMEKFPVLNFADKVKTL